MHGGRSLIKLLLQPLLMLLEAPRRVGYHQLRSKNALPGLRRLHQALHFDQVRHGVHDRRYYLEGLLLLCESLFSNLELHLELLELVFEGSADGLPGRRGKICARRQLNHFLC